MRSYNSDHRTPLAWRQRENTLHMSPTRGQNHSNHHHHHHHQQRRPPTPSETTTTSGDEREEVPIVRHGTPFHNHHHHHHHHQRRSGSRSRDSSTHQHQRDGHSQFSSGAEGPFRNGGTLRSTRSVPALALATWDGEPCPVHGHGVPLYHQPPMPYAAGSLRRHGSLFDMRSPFFPHGGLLPPPPPHPALMIGPPPLLDKKAFHGSMQMLGPAGHFPPHFLPPMMRPRPFVFPAGVEPLPVRDPYKNRTPPPSGYAGSKTEDPYSVDQVCCKGHLIVLWIILAVVTIGVILGIVLGVTIA